jgi:hypothetical protein
MLSARPSSGVCHDIQCYYVIWYYCVIRSDTGSEEAVGGDAFGAGIDETLSYYAMPSEQ